MIEQSKTQNEYRVLARKYRPQTLSDLRGQEILSTTLKKAIAEGRVPHAFLFHGIRGVGKTTTARILAKALNCSGADGKGNITCDPCGVCSSCIAIQEDRHLDVIEMDAASHTGVDDIREVIDACRYKAVQGRYKVFIIDEVHMLSKSAFNALLKTLEEPPSHVKFIFATTELRKIPETVLSRCQRFDLKRMDQETLITYLGEIAEKEGFKTDDLALSIIARAADGSMRDGVSLLDQAISLTQSHDTVTIKQEIVRDMLGQADRGLIIDLLEALFHGDVENGISYARKILDTGSDPLLLLQDILDFIYALTTHKTQSITPDLGFSKAEMDRFFILSKNISISIMLQSWQVLVKGYEELSRSPLQAQTLEMILLRLCYILPITTLDNPPSSQNSNNDNTPSKQGNGSNQKLGASSIDTLKDLLTALEQKKEMMLHAHLRHDVHLFSFQDSHIRMRLNHNINKTFIPLLKQFLEKTTQKIWDIEAVDKGGADTLVQKQENAKLAQEDEAKNDPLVQKLLNAFPDSHVTVYH